MDQELRHTNCPVCTGKIAPLWQKTNRFGSFSIFSCSSCGFGFVNPTPTSEFIFAFYEASGHANERSGEAAVDTLADVLRREEMSPNSSIDAIRMVSRAAKITDGRSLLDVGCGFGFTSKIAQDHGFSVTALEIASNERAVASQMLGQEPVASTFESFRDDRGFDVIVMSQILEHAREPVEWIRKARRMLNAGGILTIALPNFSSVYTALLKQRDPYVIPPAHLNYFTPRSLKMMLEGNGFRVVQVETISRFPKSTFSKRLGGLGSIAAPSVNKALGLFDLLKSGAMINAYAAAA